MERVGKKFGGGRKRRSRRRRQRVKGLAMPRNNISLRRLPPPKRVQLPNGRGCVFFAKYQKVGRHALTPTRVRIVRTYVRKIGPRRQRIRRIDPRKRRRKR